MSRRPESVPKYRLHKPTGQAVVTVRVSGKRKDVYLGKHDSPESRRRYAEIVKEMAAAPASGEAPPSVARPLADLTVSEILLPFIEHATQHYRRADGTPTSEIHVLKMALRPLRELYGSTAARAFGPLALVRLRDHMVTQKGWSRSTVNAAVNRVRRVFKWAASRELVPAAVHASLKTVEGLERGRTAAPEPDPVEPVPLAHVEAILPHVRPTVATMLRVQLLTGMRPGEVCRLRPCDIDMTGEVWVYRPPHHKNTHREKPRVIAIGPKAQELLRPLLPADPDGYVFSPRRSVATARAERSDKRVTPRYPSHMRRNAQKRSKAPQRAAGVRYSPHSVACAVARACERAGVPHWHPNQLRHTHGTEVRRRFGLEAAQVALGHSKADVTQIYAERNLDLARQVAGEVG